MSDGDFTNLEVQKFPTLSRFLSSRLTPYLVKTSLTPNQITLINFFIVGLSSLYFLSVGNYWTGILGALLFQLFYVLDNCDGEVARIKGLSSRIGGWMDIGSDAIIHSFLFLAIALGVWKNEQNPLYLWFALSTFSGVIITFTIVMVKQAINEKRITKIKPGQKSRILENVRDFAVLVVLCAILNALWLLSWASAIGIHMFWLSLLIFKVREGEF